MICRACGQPLVYAVIEGVDGLCVWEAPGLLKKNSCAKQAAEHWFASWSRRRELPPYTDEEWIVNVHIWLESRKKE